MMRGQMQEKSMGMARMVTMARYLPITTPDTDTGAVSSSWSVRLRRSSAMERMVRMGMSTMNKKRVASKEAEK